MCGDVRQLSLCPMTVLNGSGVRGGGAFPALVKHSLKMLWQKRRTVYALTVRRET